MLTTLLLCATALVGDPTVSWEASSNFVDGSSYQVSVEITAPTDGSPVASWLLTPAAFTIDGKPLAARKAKDVISLAPGAKLSLSFDLEPAIKASKAFQGGKFQLGFAKQYQDAKPLAVTVAKAAPAGLDFMSMPVEELGKYRVLMSTNRGDMLFEFWPEAAPGHVRNFLDLCYTGFYDGLTFHRVLPGFMIQGGCPNGDGSGNGPRKLQAEFSTDSKYSHVRGVLSMARTGDPNSASCQFFVMHQNQNPPYLDGQYSAFGKCISGLEVVDRIVSSPKGAGDKPIEKQVIEKATVILAD